MPPEAVPLSRKVLVVDDEPGFVSLVRARLKAEGYEVIAAADGEEALLKVKDEKPDVVLMDILMPKLDGLKTLRRLRKLDKLLPVYMLTSFSSPERFEEAKKLGAAGFIVKSGDLKQQLERITGSLSLSQKFRPNGFTPLDRSKRHLTGFTLFEVIVALGLLVTGVTVIAGVFSLGLLASSDREDLQRALAIAQAKMEEVQNTDVDALANSGPTADPVFDDYQVTLAVSGANPKLATVTVAWTPQGGQTSISLATRMADLDG